MDTEGDFSLPLEVLLAAAIIGNGGSLTITRADLQSDLMDGKQIAIEVDEAGLTLTLEGE